MASVDLSLSRKSAILAFLVGGPVTLSELANRFGRPWQDMRDELTELFVIEIEHGGFYVSPFDIVMDDDDPGPETLVSLGDIAEADVPSMTLAEVISVLALIDALLEVSDSRSAPHLSSLRDRLTRAAIDAGYESALWPAPRPVAPHAVIDTLNAAIAERKYVRIGYWKASSDPHLSRSEHDIAPVGITTGDRPLLVAANDSGELRRFRVDRINSVDVIDRGFSVKLRKAMLRQVEDEGDFIEGTPAVLWCEPRSRWVAEQLPGVKAQEIDGLLRLEFPIRSEAWLRTLLIRLGTYVVRIEPPELATSIAEQARVLLASEVAP